MLEYEVSEGSSCNSGYEVMKATELPKGGEGHQDGFSTVTAAEPDCRWMLEMQGVV